MRKIDLDVVKKYSKRLVEDLEKTGEEGYEIDAVINALKDANEKNMKEISKYYVYCPIDIYVKALYEGFYAYGEVVSVDKYEIQLEGEENGLTSLGIRAISKDDEVFIRPEEYGETWWLREDKSE